MFWLIASAVLIPLSVVVPARPDHQGRRETFTDFWARHSPRRDPASARKVALTALAAHSNTLWWTAVLIWPTIRAALVALWWALRLLGRIAAGLAHMTVKLTPRALRSATRLCALLWAAAEWLNWHIDQLAGAPEPSNAPQLA
ncbi:hypothetical protein ACGFJC_47325 [Nonomuraea fuscirosea]|uniref:hypothetical protein n=1 Tax=Nonomuraea fuscirosea TaxID=1291556 RepID=UPI00371CF32A